MRIFIFFTIVTLVFGSLGYYLYHRIAHTFSGTFLASRTFMFIYIFLVSSFFLGKILENIHINPVSDTLIRIGGYSLGFFFYGILVFAFFDLVGLLNRILPFYPAFIRDNLAEVRSVLGTVFAVAIVALGTFGIWNSFQPRIKNLELTVEKKAGGLSEMNVVAISDVHLGTMVNKIKVKKLVDRINALNPDLVLIAGDVVDDNVHAVKQYGLIEFFKELNPKYGVHGIMGNHEYIGRSYSELDYYKENNINMLIDSSILIDDKFYIVGRDDIQAKAFYSRDRKDLATLMTGIDRSKPVFLLDHQPYNLELSEKEGVDLHFSGHTHHGQLWPFNYITGAMFENDWGYLRKGNTHYYVSCGYGTAVIPMRIASHPEIVNIRMKFAE